ncbi:MAG: arylsulfatase [Pirellulales bacterium]|nr:arylsulfatase [Pirellulales bacterium]
MRFFASWSPAPLLFIVLFGSAAAAVQPDELRRPNILLILADDMGYSDLGCYGSEISTPHLDALAAGGLRYSQFYNTARCWPTRAALLTGYYAQQVNRDALPVTRVKTKGQRPAWAQLLPALLRPLGYHSYLSGKWHVDGEPADGGFERAYVLRDQDRFFTAKNHRLDGRPLRAMTLDDKYYATTAIADYAIDFLKDHRKHYAGQPFFQYVAFTSPHFPLHAPPEDIARYADRYAVGWDRIRADRWQEIKQRGLVPGTLSRLEPGVGPPYHFSKALELLGAVEVNRELAWDALSAEQRAFQATKMAIHAAMVDRMDQEVGRIARALKQMGEYENTVIFFLSDNGASAEIMVRGDGHDLAAAPGSAASYLCLGPGWSRAANTPFRRHKTWVHEGGIATSMIVHGPTQFAAQGELRSAVGHVIDIAPTILELAGGVWPKEHDGEDVPEPPGRSLVDTFSKDQPLVRDALWWLHEGNRAIRAGDWKAVAARDEPWELYDLAQDRAETRDLAAMLPARVEQLTKLWDETTRKFQELVER